MKNSRCSKLAFHRDYREVMQKYLDVYRDFGSDIFRDFISLFPLPTYMDFADKIVYEINENDTNARTGNLVSVAINHTANTNPEVAETLMMVMINYLYW